MKVATLAALALAALASSASAQTIGGRYQVAGFFPDGYVDETGSIHLAPQMSAFIAYRHFWSAALRSTVELSAATSSPPDGTANGVNKSDRSAHLNLIWSPIPAVDLGACGPVLRPRSQCGSAPGGQHPFRRAGGCHGRSHRGAYWFG